MGLGRALSRAVPPNENHRASRHKTNPRVYLRVQTHLHVRSLRLVELSLEGSDPRPLLLRCLGSSLAHLGDSLTLRLQLAVAVLSLFELRPETLDLPVEFCRSLVSLLLESRKLWTRARSVTQASYRQRWHACKDIDKRNGKEALHAKQPSRAPMNRRFHVQSPRAGVRGQAMRARRAP